MDTMFYDSTHIPATAAHHARPPGNSFFLIAPSVPELRK